MEFRHKPRPLGLGSLTSLYESGRNKFARLDYGQDIDLAFTHDKIREVLHQWLNPLRRRALHRLVSAFIAIQAGHWDEAKLAGDNAYAVAGMLHDADLQSRVLWSRSVCAGWQGDWTRAISDILAAIQVAQHESETLLVYPYLLMQAAKAYFFAGRRDSTWIKAWSLRITGNTGNFPR